MGFNNCPQIKFCENTVIKFNFTSIDYEILETLFLEIKDCKVLCLSQEKLDDVHIQIDIPICIFNQIIDEQLSWDEAFVGYWCRFFRENDESLYGEDWIISTISTNNEVVFKFITACFLLFEVVFSPIS